MQTNNVRWQQDSDGTWVCVQVSHRQALDVCSSIRPGKTYDVTIKPHRERRSLDANAYCWVLLDKLAEVLQVKKEDLYREEIPRLSAFEIRPWTSWWMAGGTMELAGRRRRSQVRSVAAPMSHSTTAPVLMTLFRCPV